MKKIRSPNFDSRNPNIALDYIVLHYTGMKNEKYALDRLCDPASKVSAHYVIGEDGCVWQLVDEADKAWHAGKGFWRGIRDMNSASIGIELVNPGHEFGYRPFPDAQISALKKLTHRIIARHRLSTAASLLAHSDIAPTRKQDPGEFFPWESLAQEGLGLWPSPCLLDLVPAKKRELIEMIDFIGYDTADFDASLVAFQRRFCPQSMGKGADKETVARMRSLKRQMSV